MFSTYQQAVKALYQRINFETLSAGEPQGYSQEDFKLDRMRKLLEAIGNPQQKIRAIHVAGTKGKGTTCTFVAQILQKAGYRVGLFTSPHLYQVEERMQVNGNLPTEKEFTELVNRLMPFCEQLERENPELKTTFFEILNALAWQYFLDQKVDFVVLEVGLGGRLDSTVLCEPLVTAITCISYDHTTILGNTLTQIAREKAGILKSGIPVVSGVVDEEPKAEVSRVAKKVEAPISLVQRDFEYQVSSPWHETKPSQTIRYSSFDTANSTRNEITFSLKQPGEAVAQNATLAIAIIEQLQRQEIEIPNSAIQEGIESSSLPLRFEIISPEDQPLILDSAHNEMSVESVIKTTKQCYPGRPITVILSVSRDKDYHAICRQLDSVEQIILTRYQGNPRALPIHELEQAIRSSCSGSVSVFQSSEPEEALGIAMVNTPSTGVIVATGSLILAAEVRGIVLSYSI